MRRPQTEVFYGTTLQGGSTNQGTVFKITSAGVLTTLHSFSGVDGDNPQAGLIQAANKLIRVPKSRPLYPPGR